MDDPRAYPSPPVQEPAAAPRYATYYIKVVPPTLTRILLVANLLVFVAMIVYGYRTYGIWTGPEHIGVLVAFGAKVNELIAEGQIWRLFTAMFLHIGVLHLLVNLYALNALGPLVEGYYDHWRFAAIYLVAGLAGSLASFAFSPAISAGASGAIFGLAGAITVYFLRYRDNFGARGQAILQNMLVVIGINLIFGLTARGIDNWGHIGGLVGGALAAWGLLPRYLPPALLSAQPQPLQQAQRSSAELLWVLLLIALLWLALQAAQPALFTSP